MKDHSNKVIPFIGATCIIFIVWYLGAYWLNEPFLPCPLLVVSTFPTLAQEYNLWLNVLVTTGRLLSALGIAALIGAPLGYLCGRYPWFDRFWSPFIQFFYPLPKIVFLPIIIVLFGLGNGPKVALITLIIVFQIMVIIRDEAKKIPAVYMLTMASRTTSTVQWLKHLYIPYLLPALITSLRISLGTAIAVLFISETFVSVDGIGYMILDAMESRNYVAMYQSILLLSGLGFLLYGILTVWESIVSYEN